MPITAQQAQAVLDRADQIFSKAEINAALDRIAQEIHASLSDKNPLVLVLMTGGFITASELLLRLGFPLGVDYIHATRYGDLTSGNQLRWIAEARKSLQGRHILIVDDILDEGETLAAILDYCREQGAASVQNAVLVEKQHDRKSGIKHADYTGLVVPDRYVFGYGMDYKGYWRNLAGIYAANKNDE